MKAALSILAICIVFPIWVYLMYSVLARVQATDLMWFLFWVYAPASFLAQIMARLIASEDK